MTGDRLGNCYVTYAEPVIYGARTFVAGRRYRCDYVIYEKDVI